MTWDYRCPFARNGHEHLLDGLEAGAPWDVRFVPFFLNQSHVPEGGTPAWDDPAQQADLLALAAGVVVRDRHPELFPTVHRSLFTARHDEGGDLRTEAVVAEALTRAGADADQVLAEVEVGLAGQGDPRRARTGGAVTRRVRRADVHPGRSARSSSA